MLTGRLLPQPTDIRSQREWPESVCVCVSCTDRYSHQCLTSMFGVRDQELQRPSDNLFVFSLFRFFVVWLKNSIWDPFCNFKSVLQYFPKGSKMPIPKTHHNFWPCSLVWAFQHCCHIHSTYFGVLDLTSKQGEPSLQTSILYSSHIGCFHKCSAILHLTSNIFSLYPWY